MRRLSERSTRSSRTLAPCILTLLLACADPPTAPAAFEMEIASGDVQAAEAGSQLPLPLTVRVTRGGVAVGDIPIEWLVGEAGGLVSSSATPSVTDRAGYARVYRTVGSVGPVSTTARIDADGGLAVEFTSYGQIAGAMRLVRHPEDEAEQSDTVLSVLRPFRVVVTDYLDRPVPDVDVKWGTGVTTQTDAQGVAEYVYTLPAQATSREIPASVNGLQGSPVRFMAVARAGNPVGLESVEGQNQLVLTGVTLGRYLVEARDAHGNAVPGVAIDWAITAGGGTIGPARSVTATDFSYGTFRPAAAAFHELGDTDGAVVATATAAGLTVAPQITFNSTAVTAFVHVFMPDDYYCWYYGYCDPAFVPSMVEIPQGRSVGWPWLADCDVVFEDDPNPPASSSRTDARRHVRTFTNPGTYRFRCPQHSTDFSSGMVGTVIVKSP